MYQKKINQIHLNMISKGVKTKQKKLNKFKYQIQKTIFIQKSNLKKVIKFTYGGLKDTWIFFVT